MRILKALTAFACVAVGIVRCVGDDSVTPPDGGGDASQDATLDGAQGNDSGDASDASPPPALDGSLAWFQHFNSSFPFEDLGVNDNGSTVVVAGGFDTDPANTPFTMGSHQFGPANLTDPFLATLNASGVVWAQWQQPGSVNGGDAGCTAWPSSNEDLNTGVTVDDSTGNIFMSGSTSSFGLILKDELYGKFSYVAGFTNAGTALWQHVYSVDGAPINGQTDNGDAKIAVATQGGKVFVAFGFEGTLTYDTGDAGPQTVSSPSSFAIFIAALDATSGATLWQKTLTSAVDVTVEQLASTPQGDVLMVGTMGPAALNGPTGTGFPLSPIGDGGGGSDVYLAKLDTNGNALYAVAFGDENPSNTFGRGVAYANGVVAISGYLFGTVDFGKGPITSGGGEDGFVIAWDETTKKTTFSAALAGTGDDEIDSVAIDAWGQIFVAGTYGEDEPASATFGGVLFPETTPSVSALMLAKLSPTGTLLWSHGFMPTAPDGGVADQNTEQDIFGLRLHTMKSGQVAVTGFMSGGADFGAGYQGVLSTAQVETSCGLLISNGHTYCTCGERTADGFVGVWQP